MNCPQCNSSAEPGEAFCQECGTDLTQTAARPQPAPVASTAAQAGAPTCPNTDCGASNPPDARFCEQCGLALGQDAPSVLPAAQSEVPPDPVLLPTPASPPPACHVTGRLVVQGSNQAIVIPPGKSDVVIGREDNESGVFPEVDVEPYGGYEAGVSRQHARLTAHSDQVYVEDNRSVNKTYLNKQPVVPGQPKPVNDGDELRFGDLTVIYHAS